MIRNRHVTITESHIHIPDYHKLTDQLFGTMQPNVCASRLIIIIKAYHKLPIILKYCSMLLDTYNALKKCKHYLYGPSVYFIMHDDVIWSIQRKFEFQAAHDLHTM